MTDRCSSIVAKKGAVKKVVPGAKPAKKTSTNKSVTKVVDSDKSAGAQQVVPGTQAAGT